MSSLTTDPKTVTTNTVGSAVDPGGILRGLQSGQSWKEALNPVNVTKNTASSILDPGGFFGLGSKKKTDNVSKSAYYNFSEDAANAYAKKDPNSVTTWRQTGGNRTYSQWLKDWIVASQGYADPAANQVGTDALNWLQGYDTYGADPDVVAQQQSFEQGLSDYVLNNYIYPDLNADQQRSETAAQILSNYAPQLDAVRKQISDLYPTEAGGQSGLLKEQLGYNTGVTNDQLAALKAQTDANNASLQTQVSGLNDNLAAEVAAKNAALKQQLTADTSALNTHLDTLKANLGVELGAKADALKQQLAALTSGVDTLTTAQRAALAQQLATNYQSLEDEVAAKQQNLTAELNSLGNAADAQSQARKAALETELNGLYAAQAPLNAIREQGAQTLATSVNLGVQSKQDAILADMAQQGYVGGSTATDAALARESIAGRQQAAQALADARTLNASDVAKIGQYGATEGYTIDSDTAANKYDLAKYGANQTRTLGDYGATQKRTITDYGAGENRTISNNDASKRFDITAANAKSNLDLANYGAEQGRQVGDYGSKTLFDLNTANNKAMTDLANYGASQGRTISDYNTNATKQNADYNSSETRNINDTSAQRKLNYFDQDIARRLSSLSLPSQAVQAEFQLRNMADEYGQSGLQRAYKNLGFFDTSGNSSAPNTGAYTGYQGTDSGFENLGAGLVSLAGSIGNANKWWASPTASSGSGGTTSSVNTPTANNQTSTDINRVGATPAAI